MLFGRFLFLFFWREIREPSTLALEPLLRVYFAQIFRFTRTQFRIKNKKTTIIILFIENC